MFFSAKYQTWAAISNNLKRKNWGSVFWTFILDNNNAVTTIQIDWFLKEDQSHWIAQKISLFIWQWSGHIVRKTHGRWGGEVVECRPRSGRRTVRRPSIRWTDDLVRPAGSQLMHVASNQLLGKSLGETYVQWWTSCGWYDVSFSELNFQNLFAYPQY